MCEGKSFHKHAPATGKARHPTVESLTAETNYQMWRTEVLGNRIEWEREFKYR